MKTQKWMRWALMALLAVTILQSCSKDDELIPQSDKPVYTVRPDFALLDTRPPQVIEQFTITGANTEPVMLLKSATVGGKYALVIGISDYKGDNSDLTYCDDDALDWASKLSGYNVTKLLDLDATIANIESAVNTLAGLAIAGNEIVLCYSGHGSKGRIVSSDLYYIGSSWFKTKFANAKSTKMFFCFDACQIGAMATDLNGTGRVIAVASNKTTYSYDGDEVMKNGVFTYYQMEWFNASQDNIYVESDCKYACDWMKIWASQYRGIKVAPSYVDSYTGNFVL